jgi:Na+/H+-dicarboxylate symporter
MSETHRKGIALHWQILLGLAAGVMAGALLNVLWSPEAWRALGVGDPAAYLAGREAEANAGAALLAALARTLVRLNAFVGDLFIRSLQFIAVPIVLFSLIVGASSLNDLKKLSRIGGRTIAVYMMTTALAITIGLILANLVQPGLFVSAEIRDSLAGAGLAEASAKMAAAKAPDIWTTLLELVPANPFAALAEGNMLQVVFFALAVGISLTLVPAEKAAVVTTACDAMTDVIIKLVHVIMKVAPYAVFALLVKVIAQLGVDVLSALFAYTAVVIAGLALMMFGVYPSIVRALARVGIRRFFRAIAPAQLLAFSSSSSSATLPVTMECMEERMGVHEEVAAFALPLGATINMDGTALYQGVATLFIAQIYGIPLDLGQQLTIVLTATLASIGTAGVPGVGIVMLVIVLQAVGMPSDAMAGGIAIIFGVDRILDMCRTACNVTGDCMVATYVAAKEGALLTEEEVELELQHIEQVGLDEHPAA